ncbi:hypothetical protein RchiOBHm_Chr5g0013461 [Rosa chinensis]|uniref:Uncharacterized protein n=1 Tax=Rosa chinensis TaxID=74649 RepID=A0A2P6Q5E2_ROSCH|nr:hypothetical protein RchiOBHm_Chr5g0013461 [Rosa chinensis]
MRFWNRSLGYMYKSGFELWLVWFRSHKAVCWFGCIICDCILASLSFGDYTQCLVSDISLAFVL